MSYLSRQGISRPHIQDLAFERALHAIITYDLSGGTKPEAFLSHQLWGPLLIMAACQARLCSWWEVLCRRGGEHQNGKMLADFGAYATVDDKTCYVILAELEREANGVHKDFVVLVAEMRLLLDKVAREVPVDAIEGLKMFGLLLTGTSAQLLSLQPRYDRDTDDLSFLLSENLDTFNFSSTQPIPELIDTLVRFFSFFVSLGDSNVTGIRRDVFTKKGVRIQGNPSFCTCLEET